MATAAQIISLIKSHNKRDNLNFYTVAMQMAATEARHGNTELADEIVTLVKSGQAVWQSQPAPEIPSELVGLVTEEAVNLRLADLVLSQEVREGLSRVRAEHKHRARLAEYGLAPRRKLLLVGPPGTGKTLSAFALAGEMGLPLYRVVLERLISRYLGETAAKIAQVFEMLQSHRGVYLFDEFDAIGAHRSTQNDVGEMRRVLNTFLVSLEHDASSSVIIAATNFPEMLDHALFRRFDDVLRYKNPTTAQINEILHQRLRYFSTQHVEWDRVIDAARGLSFADIVNAANDAAKEAVLTGADDIDSDLLRIFLEARLRT